MKAAVLYEKGGMPRYADLAEPVVQNDNEVLVSVKAVAIKHVDKSRASGKHYSTEGSKEEARVIGGDGVFLMADGTRVYGMGVSGTLAEKATIIKDRIVKVPDGIDNATAAALPNAVFGAAMALRFRADIQPGDTVLINGATSFPGRIAVQIARYYGAKKVIATGRNPQSLTDLLSLGADEIISVQQDDEQFMARIKAIHQATPINVIVDYLWGHTAELLLACLKGTGAFTPKSRFVSVGSMSGDLIQLSAANLRSVDLHLSGSGLGSWTKPQVHTLFADILPEMFQLAADGKLSSLTTPVSLKDIETLWNLTVPDGQRLVVIID